MMKIKVRQVNAPYFGALNQCLVIHILGLAIRLQQARMSDNELKHGKRRLVCVLYNFKSLCL